MVVPEVTTDSLTVTTTGGSVSQFGTGDTDVISTGIAAWRSAGVLNLGYGFTGYNGNVTVNAGTTGNITLGANNVFAGVNPANVTVAANNALALTGNNIVLTAKGITPTTTTYGGNITISALNAAGSVTINTAPSTFGNGTVTFGVGGGSSSPVITVGGNLAVSTNGSNIKDDPQAQETIFGAITINTMAAGFGQLSNNVVVTGGGAGYASAPIVTITGGAGSGAVATATVNTTTGAVTGISITNGGGGFSSSPTLAVVGGGNHTGDRSGTTTISSGFVTAADLTSIATTGYVSTPVITLTAAPSGGTNATATATVDTTTGTILAINITNPGAGYTVAPTLTVTGGTANITTAPAFTAASIIPKGDVTFTAQGNQGSGTYGQFNINAASVNIVERTTLNLGTINATSVSTQSTAGDVLINGTQNVYNNGGWSARANAGNITQITGAINAGTGSVTANLNGSNGKVDLSNSSNIFGALSYNTSGSASGNILVGSSVTLNQLSVSGTSNIAVTTTGTGSNITVSAGSFNGTATFNSSGSIVLTSNNSTNTVAARNLILIAADTGVDSITQNTASASQIVNVNGTLTLSTAGGVTLTGTNNPSLGNVVLSNLSNTTAAINLSSRGNIASVSGSAAGTVTLTSGTVGQNSTPIASTITLGNLTAGNLVARALNGGDPGQAINLLSNGASGDIKQATNSSLHVENILTAITFNGGNIVLNNAGNSAGRVQLSTAGALPTNAAVGVNPGTTAQGVTLAQATAGTGAGLFAVPTAGSSGNISYTEDSTAKVGALQTTGAANLTSRFGGVIEDPTTAVALNVAGLLTASAANGSVSLGNTTHTAGATTSNITAATVSALGSAALTSSSSLSLGSVAANSLSVTAANITQSAPLSVFGLSSFNVTTDAGNITLNDSANNFGPLALTAARNATISVTESSTLNLRSVSMGFQGTPGLATAAGNGTLTLTSVNGDIIDTGLGGVKAGGIVAPSGVLTPAGTIFNGSGVVSLTAVNGNVVIDDPTSDILTSAGVVFNAKNVTLSVLGSAGSTLVLGAASLPSVATGNLTATSALGNIGNLGSLKVGALASFQTGNGNITISQPDVGFGQLRFTGNQVQIKESGAMDILAGSSAFGPAQLVSGGSINIVLADTQSVTFGSNVALQATGDITLRRTQVVGNLTLAHTGTANLSALSKSTDLNGRDPIDLGTGPYVAPSP